MKKVRVFVYGTLMRQEPNNQIMTMLGGEFVEKSRTSGGYLLWDIRGHFPGMTKDPSGKSVVAGEVWEVPEESVQFLDSFEGVGRGMYSRIKARLGDGSTAYAYEASGEMVRGAGDMKISSGDWRAYRSRGRNH